MGRDPSAAAVPLPGEKNRGLPLTLESADPSPTRGRWVQVVQVQVDQPQESWAGANVPGCSSQTLWNQVPDSPASSHALRLSW